MLLLGKLQLISSLKIECAVFLLLLYFKLFLLYSLGNAFLNIRLSEKADFLIFLLLMVFSDIVGWAESINVADEK